MMPQRNQSLDALRGLAILGMVLSGSIAFGGVLPAWMYHEQVPPPQHFFTPTLSGITWVDLVFPFFLFCMGAAMPLALRKHLEAGQSKLFIAGLALKRFLLLAFFAVFTHQLKAWNIADSPGVQAHVLSIMAFVALCVVYTQPKKYTANNWAKAAKWFTAILMVLALWLIPHGQGKSFDFYKSDIIIMVLANMALVGTLCYYCTAQQPMWRLALLPVVAAFFLAGNAPQPNWVSSIFHFREIGNISIDWLYKFYFLKYLFLIIVGSFAGQWLMQQSTQEKTGIHAHAENGLSVIAILLILVNLYGLFTRHLVTNVVLTASLTATAIFLSYRKMLPVVTRKMVMAGSYLLLLGLCIEPWEGGIKKDPSTYSYYFVTAGLAFYALIFLNRLATASIGQMVVGFLAANGKNPMVAYVAGSLLVLPLLALSGLAPYWNGMQQNTAMALLKGLLFTGAVSAITLYFNKRGWYWKT